jgi:diadenylate cyclase
MPNDPKDSKPERLSAELGFTRSPSDDDPRRDPKLLAALRRIAPGTELRAGMDDIIRGHLGALIVIGEPQELQFLFSGGLQLDHPFTPQFLYELAKMDGAIILNSDSSRIVCANVQLMPDPTIASSETGTRHRTAERVAKQTGALVISISQARDTVSVYVGDIRYQLEAIADILAKTNQAVATLETYSGRLEQVSARLTALEFQSAVTLDDVLVVVQRAEMATRMGEEVERNVIELGREGWLIEMQLGELMRDIPRDRVNVIRDYEMAETTGGSAKVLRRLAGLSHNRLLDFEVLADCLGHGGVNPLDLHLRPRGYRALAQIPRLTERQIASVVGAFDGLDSILRASLRELEACEGIAASTARDIREGLRRLQEHNLMDRYLQL